MKIVIIFSKSKEVSFRDRFEKGNERGENRGRQKEKEEGSWKGWVDFVKKINLNGLGNLDYYGDPFQPK